MSNLSSVTPKQFGSSSRGSIKSTPSRTSLRSTPLWNKPPAPATAAEEPGTLVTTKDGSIVANGAETPKSVVNATKTPAKTPTKTPTRTPKTPPTTTNTPAKPTATPGSITSKTPGGEINEFEESVATTPAGVTPAKPEQAAYTPSISPTKPGQAVSTPSITPAKSGYTSPTPGITPAKSGHTASTPGVTPDTTGQAAYTPSVTPAKSGQAASMPSITPAKSGHIVSIPVGTPDTTEQSASTPSITPAKSGQAASTPSITPAKSGHTASTPGVTPDTPGHTASTPGVTTDTPRQAASSPSVTPAKSGQKPPTPFYLLPKQATATPEFSPSPPLGITGHEQLLMINYPVGTADTQVEAPPTSLNSSQRNISPGSQSSRQSPVKSPTSQKASAKSPGSQQSIKSNQSVPIEKSASSLKSAQGEGEDDFEDETAPKSVVYAEETPTQHVYDEETAPKSFKATTPGSRKSILKTPSNASQGSRVSMQEEAAVSYASLKSAASSHNGAVEEHLETGELASISQEIPHTRRSLGSRSLTMGSIPINKSLDFVKTPVAATDVPSTSVLSVGEDKKTVSIDPEPEVVYIERRSAMKDEREDEVEDETVFDDIQGKEDEKVEEKEGSPVSQNGSGSSTQSSRSEHSGSEHSGSEYSGSQHSGSPHSGSPHSGSQHSGSRHSGSRQGSESSAAGSHTKVVESSPTLKSSIKESVGGSTTTMSLQGLQYGDEVMITPMIQPLSQTESVLNRGDVVDPFKAFARKIATQFTAEDISAIHYLANIPEKLQAQLTTGVAVMNYLTNNRRLNVQFLQILLEEMERVDLLEELLAWTKEKNDFAREAQKRGQQIGIAGPSEDESTFITVAQRMRERILDPGTHVRGCEELVTLMGNVRAQVAECSIAIILAAMRHHIMSEPVQEAGCVTLANICYHHRTLHALIVMQGGIRHILLAMRSHVRNDLVQRAACGAIANISLRYDDIRKQCVNDGVIKAVVNAMTAHKEEPTVQEQGCCALCNLATNQPKIQLDVAKTGGLECIMTALKVHKNNEDVVGNALTALQILCSYNKSIQEEAQDLHGMEYAINSMLAFPQSDEVMESVCGVLGNMCSESSKNRELAGKNGAMKIVVDAIHSKPENEDMVTRALILLSNSCFNNDVNRIIAKKLGAIEAIVLGMKTHPTSAKVQRQACRALSNICVKNVDLKEEVLANGVIEHVCKALQTHVMEARVVEPVLSALYSLCVYHGLRAEIDATNIELLIGNIRQNYPVESKVYERAEITDHELRSDDNCFGFIGNWRKFSEAMWGGGEVYENEAVSEPTTIPRQALSAMSNQLQSVKSQMRQSGFFTPKTAPIKVQEAAEGNISPYSEQIKASQGSSDSKDLEAGLGSPTNKTPKLPTTTPKVPTETPKSQSSKPPTRPTTEVETSSQAQTGMSLPPSKHATPSQSGLNTQTPKARSRPHTEDPATGGMLPGSPQTDERGHSTQQSKRSEHASHHSSGPPGASGQSSHPSRTSQPSVASQQRVTGSRESTSSKPVIVQVSQKPGQRSYSQKSNNVQNRNTDKMASPAVVKSQDQKKVNTRQERAESVSSRDSVSPSQRFSPAPGREFTQAEIF